MAISLDAIDVSAGELQQLDAASLSKLIAELQQSKADLEARRFIETSLAKFADLMRWQPTDDLPSWVERLLAEIVVTVGALQTCMYMSSQISRTGSVVNGDNFQEIEENTNEVDIRELILVGTYAHDDDNTPTKIKFGNGLIGQAAKSKRSTVFNRNAKIQTRTYTGLALLQPQSLIIQPLVYNDIVEGVLEISSVEEFSTQQIDFIRLLSEAIAANLMTIRSQEEMRRLYIAMQAKTESLTSQEEEMRQNMEEMAATQEEMARLRDQAEQQAALQSSTIDSFQDGIIAVDSKLNIILFNASSQKMAGILGDVLEKGKSIEHYYKEDIRAEQKGNWVRAINGDSFSSEERRLSSDGQSELIFHYRYSPIFNLKRTEMLGACALLRNVTDERMRQIEIENLKIKAERQSNFLESLLDGMQSGVIAIDSQLNIRLFNKLGAKTCEKYGIDIRLGNPFIELIHSKQREQFLHHTKEALTGNSKCVTLFYKFTEEDQGAWFDVSFISIIENDGRISGVIVEFKNVNEKMIQSIEVEELKNNAITQSSMLQSMMDGMQSGIVTVDLLYNIQLFNSKASIIVLEMGFPLKTGDPFLEKISLERRKIFEGFLQKAATGEVTEITIPYKFRDRNETDWFEMSFIPIFETGEKISGVIVEFKEVTEKKKQQLKIEELNLTATAERNLRQLVIDNMDTGLIAIDRDYRLTIANEPALKLFANFGISIQTGTFLGDTMDPESKDVIMEDWRRAMNGESIRKLNTYKFSENNVQVHEVNYTPAFNADKSEIEGVVVLFRDVTSASIQTTQIEKLKEEAIAQKSYLESIFNGYTNPMLAIDRNYTLTAFNEYAHRFFSALKVKLSIGLNIVMVYGLRYEEVANNFRRVLEKGETFTDVEVFNENTDYILALEASYGPIYDDKKEVVGAWVFTKDITDLKIQEQILQRKNEELRKNLDRMHEIEEALKIEKLKNDQLLNGSISSKEHEKNRQLAEKNYSKFKAQIDHLSGQLTQKDAEIKKLKAELESRI